MQLELASRLCYLSYLPADEAIGGYNELGYMASKITAFSDADEAFLLLLKGRAIVAIRGSDDAKDWVLRNMRAVPCLTDAGMLHSGFHVAAESLYGPIKTVLDALAIGPSRLTFLGHSKGGATAAILAELFGGQAVTIGAPRVFMRGYRTIGRHLRYAHSCDIVPRVPQRVFGFGHIGDCVVVDGGDWAEIEARSVVGDIKQLINGKFDLRNHFAYGDLVQLIHRSGL